MTEVAGRGPGGPSPLVSVVMSTYNGARFLAEQLDTILAQSHRHLEILIRDDASTDATPDILLDYAKRDPRITVHRAPRNLGLVANLEILLREARGEYVAIADQDDVWSPEKIATLLDHLGPHAAIYSASRLIDGAGADLGCTLLQALGDREAVSGRDPLRLFWTNTVSGHALLFTRSLVGRLAPFDRHFPYDHQIGIRALADGGLAYCDAPLVRHRIHEGNQTNRVVLHKRPRHSHEGLARTWAGKVWRRRRVRRVLLQRLRFYSAGALLGSLTEDDVRRAERAARAFGRSFFNPTMFMLVLRQPGLSGGGLGRIRRAFKYAKGARWQKLGYGLLRPFFGATPAPRAAPAPTPGPAGPGGRAGAAPADLA